MLPSYRDVDYLILVGIGIVLFVRAESLISACSRIFATSFYISQRLIQAIGIAGAIGSLLALILHVRLEKGLR